jgi:hypothetical protein
MGELEHAAKYLDNVWRIKAQQFGDTDARSLQAYEELMRLQNRISNNRVSHSSAVVSTQGSKTPAAISRRG